MKPETPLPSASPSADPLLAECQNQIAALTQTVARLEAEHSALAQQVSTMRSQVTRSELAMQKSLRQKDRELLALHKLARTTSRTLNDLFSARTWRTVAYGAQLLKRARSLLGRLPRKLLNRPFSESSDEAYLVCEEPSPDDLSPRSGMLRVRGWAAAISGIKTVKVQIADRSPLQAQLGFARPDVAKEVGFQGADHAGWSCFLDTMPVADGRHEIRVEAVTNKGRSVLAETEISIDHAHGYETDYDRWITEFEQRDPVEIVRRLHAFEYSPLISVIMPVFKCPIPVLTQAIESVVNQSYTRWELCIADDHSQSAEITQLLEEYSARDPRIRFCSREQNGGISAASNSALTLASGDFVALLDHDDEFAPDALFHLVDALQSHRDADLLYSDEDKIDETGHRYDPFFKPDWSPDLLLSMNYMCHLLMLRRSVLEREGCFRSEYDGSQDYDLVLRISVVAREIVHIPKILYHWRSVAGSTAADGYAKSYAIDAARRAIDSSLKAAQIEAHVVSAPEIGRWQVQYHMNRQPQVTIIIASGGKTQILRTNVESLFAKTTYRAFDVLIADNSRGTEIETLTAELGRLGPVKYFDWRGKPFNYSEINNRATNQTGSPILLFLNDDTSVIAPEWLEVMVQHVTRLEVGAVGAKLLYPNGRIQHAGVVMGLFDNCGHGFKGMDGSRSHYFSFTDVTRNVSAVTGACLMCRAEVFREVGGFDETDFAVAFNDIDLCLKIRKAGYRVVYAPAAVLFHHEAFSKTAKDLSPHPQEVESMRRKWADEIAADPYYNPNLTRSDEDYSLRHV